MTVSHLTTTDCGVTSADRYYANPYNPDYAGFYFSTMDEYDHKADQLRAKGCGEWEIDYVDGDEAELFRACGVHQGTVGQWFDMLDELEDWQKPALFYACEYQGLTLSEALAAQGSGDRAFEDLGVTEGTALDWTEQYVDDTGMLEAVPESVRYYFDYQAFARDLVLNGDLYEFEYDGDSYVATW